MMREEYDIKALNPRKNPYIKRLEKQITININDGTFSLVSPNLHQIGFSQTCVKGKIQA